MQINSKQNNDKNQTTHSNIHEQSKQIIQIAQTEPHSALKCLHLLSVAGGATNSTYQAIAERIMTDTDASGAYHLALMAQSTTNLPVNARALIELVMEHGEPSQWLSLLKNLPLPPTEVIQAKILASDDDAVIEAMQTYLKDNPEGYGSAVTISSGQKDRIVPLSEDRS